MNSERIGVVGAGLMGREIALVFAMAGYEVHLLDRSAELVSAARQRITDVLDKGIARGLFHSDCRSSVGRIKFTTDQAEFSDLDFVTEAVFERIDVKATIYEWLAATCKPSCVIATNTSTIPITVLASHLPSDRRSRFVGTHYFSPVSRMKLVEVITGLETSQDTLETVMRLCQNVGKSPIRVKDVPGFAVNRLLHVFMIEAVRLVEEGVATPEDIDLACQLGLGHPIGPFRLMDATTSQLCLQAQQIMFDAYGERFRPRPLLKQRVEAGYVGGRDRPGWYSRDEERRAP